MRGNNSERVVDGDEVSQKPRQPPKSGVKVNGGAGDSWGVEEHGQEGNPATAKATKTNQHRNRLQDVSTSRNKLLGGMRRSVRGSAERRAWQRRQMGWAVVALCCPKMLFPFHRLQLRLTLSLFRCLFVCLLALPRAFLFVFDVDECCHSCCCWYCCSSTVAVVVVGYIFWLLLLMFSLCACRLMHVPSITFPRPESEIHLTSWLICCNNS